MNTGRAVETVCKGDETFCLYAMVNENDEIVRELYVRDERGVQYEEGWSRWNEVWDLCEGNWEDDEECDG